MPRTPTHVDLNAMIFQCFMMRYEDDYPLYIKCDNLFQPVVTDMGICPSFNPTPTDDVLKPSSYTESFIKAFKGDLKENNNLTYGEQLGQSLKLFLVRSTSDPEVIRTTIKRKPIIEPSKFYMSISRHNDYLNFKSSSFIIKAGYLTTINVEPMEIIASNDLRSVQIHKRHCRFEDETEGITLLKRYSQSGCEFEMKTRKLQKLCQCTPWYIPSMFGANFSICDTYGNYCYNSLMKNVESSKECLPNCNLVQFKQNQIMEKMDPSKVCFQNKNFWRAITEILSNKRDMKLYLLAKKVQKWLKNPMEYKNETFNREDASLEFCNYMVENYIAEVKVQFGSKKYIRTKMSVKVSFTDRLGVFGI